MASNVGLMPGIEDRSMLDKTEPTQLRVSRPVPAVYAAIQKVSGELAKTGIGKDGRNQQQNYSFRGVEQVLNALSPALVTHGLVVLPRMISRDVVERTTKSGSAQFFVTVCGEFDFVATVDGSKHTVTTYGEAQDTADKATNKAMSAAYKYAAFLAFCFPMHGVLVDADERTPEDSVPAEDGYVDFVSSLEELADGGMAPVLAAIKSDATPEAWRSKLRTSKRVWQAIKDRAAKADTKEPS